MSLSQVKESKGHYIQGKWRKGSGTVLESINPGLSSTSEGSLIWKGYQATEEEIKEAVLAAHQALPGWSILHFDQRAQIVTRFAQKVEQERNALALLISLETGKPLWESQTEVTAVINKINISIKACQERTGAKETQTAEANSCLRFKPQGVAVVLGAFNFPAHLSNGHIVPALLAGNTLLYKPSEQTPAVAEFIMQCWHDSGIPAGVINCLQGGASCGSHLLNQDIQAVYFTGSYHTGLRIHQHFSKRPEVILALEMGGNNPLIIDTVNGLKAAIYNSLLSTLITAGQRCTCARRVIIPDSHKGDEFLKGFIKACAFIKPGYFEEQPEPFMGPVIHSAQALHLLQSQKELIKSGGESLLSMQLLMEHTGLLSPGIIDMTSAKTVPDEEFFGPLVQIHRYDRFEKALELANNTRYGLAAGLFSDNKQRYQQFYDSIRAGLINWNRPTTGASSTLPFGGVGISGNHRPSAYFAADYCAYPVASMEHPQLNIPESILPGISLE